MKPILLLFLFASCTIGTSHHVTINEYPCDSDSIHKFVRYNTNIIFNSDTLKPKQKSKK